MGKRALDVAGGSILLVLTAPLVLVGAAVSALTYRAWPFFVQERIGLDGRTFRLAKIRTLAPETPATLDKHQLAAVEPPRPGRFLRGHHVDELPQLVSVVTGSMSLVGPRPEMPVLVKRLPADFARERTEVRPGLTGLWQISRAVEGLIAEAPAYDRHYVRRRTARLDAWILGRTVLELLGRAPIESLAEVPRWTGAAGAAERLSVESAAA